LSIKWLALIRLHYFAHDRQNSTQLLLVYPKELNIPSLDPVKTSTEVLTVSTKDASVSAIPSKLLSKMKFRGWWPDVEDVFTKGLMVKVLSDPKTGCPCVDGLYVHCTLCQMAKGKDDVVFTLRTPFNQFYFNQHIASPTHQQNKIRNEYFENKIKEGNIKQKMQTGMTNFVSQKRNQLQ
jgi:hypothetical protein